MVQVEINGQPAPIRTQNTLRFCDVIELAKTVIDPDHIITAVSINDRQVTDEEWMASLSTMETAIIEIDTDTVEAFCSSRLQQAPSVFQTCYVQFRDARKSFKFDGYIAGNKVLAQAVTTLRAALNWYDSFYKLLPVQYQSDFSIQDHMNKILEIAEKVCQHQLYQSWWALGVALEKELEPALDTLEDFTRQYQKKVSNVLPAPQAAAV